MVSVALSNKDFYFTTEGYGLHGVREPFPGGQVIQMDLRMQHDILHFPQHKQGASGLAGSGAAGSLPVPGGIAPESAMQ